ncbi:MAG: hypothetical protein EPN23_09620 [Verrucomicrobia bacterium]|nr:MAG: hypothetical protein EPN23_09620 [Verrucomicrobiota bacterium]
MKSMRVYSQKSSGRAVMVFVTVFFCLGMSGWAQTATPITPTPITPTPITPTTITPTPITPTTITPTTITPTPITPTTITPTPITPTPINPTPINSIQTPAIQTPNIQTPNIQTPDMQTPNIQTPDMQTPNLETPNMQTPNIQPPNIQTPNIQTPNMQTPTTMQMPALEPVPGGLPVGTTADLHQQAQQLQAEIDQFNQEAQAFNNKRPEDRTDADLKDLVTRQRQIINAINSFNNAVHQFASPAMLPKPGLQPAHLKPTQPPAHGGLSGGDAALIGVGVAGAVVAAVAVAGAASSAYNNYKCSEGYSLCTDGVCCRTYNIHGAWGAYHGSNGGCYSSAESAAQAAMHGVGIVACADERQYGREYDARARLRQTLQAHTPHK